MNLADLKPNPKNPRKITDKKLKALKKSLEEFGDLGGIVFNRRSGQIVGGHQRAAIFDKGEIILTDVDDDGLGSGHINFHGHKFSYREVFWDEDKEKAANIAANKGAGDWDWAQLGEWFLDLDAANYDLGLTMFSEGEIESALGLKEDKNKDEPPEVKAPKEVICPECNHEFLLGKS